MALAIALGGYLRFRNLSALELSADEGASWAAASASTLGEVFRLQSRLNPGELGLHDAALHLWIGGFGDGLAAMRSLSAAAGTIAICLVFIVTREVLRLPAPSPECAQEKPADTISIAATTDADDWIGAIAALLFAASLVTIKYSREARMYPIALALVLAQLIFFARAGRAGGWLNYGLTGILTALILAATLTAALMLIPEVLDVAIPMARKGRRGSRRAGAAVAIGSGLLLSLVALLFSLHLRGSAPDPRTWRWIPPPPLDAPITLFNKAAGTYVFPLLVVLAASGSIRQWARRRSGIIFLWLWMIAPPLFLTAFSDLIQPAFVERYLLPSFVPFFILAAIGALELRPAALRPGAVALVIALALAHVQSWNQKPHGEPWAEAVATARMATTGPARIGVAPRYAVNVVSYYLRDAHPAVTVEAADAVPAPAVVIVGANAAPELAAELIRRYPRQVAQQDGLVVREP